MKRLIVIGLLFSLAVFVGFGLGVTLSKKEAKTIKQAGASKKRAAAPEKPSGSVRVDPKIIAPKAIIGENLSVGRTVWTAFGSPEIIELSAEGRVYARYIIININVVNNGNEGLLFSQDTIKLIDNKGRKYIATEYVQSASYNKAREDGVERLSFGPLNPDISRAGYVEFEIADDAKGLEVEVSNGQQSGFIELKL